MANDLYIGLMSGTSLDGVDAVLACFDQPDMLLAQAFRPFPDRLRTELRSLLHAGNDEIHRSALAANELADLYADAVRELLAHAKAPRDRLRAIGCHGQTIRHDPARAYTVQIGNASRLAEATGLPVICDFRSRDIAAGGQGAPLVPAFHASVFGSPGISRAIVNIGGIANVTCLPAQGPVTGFDCGPGNALMDEWIGEQQGARYDAGGQWAAGGAVIRPLLSVLAADPYFSQLPPKSTGREYFNLKWVHPHIRPGQLPIDVQATLSELTSSTIADAIERHCPTAIEVYVCGGGASNADLMNRLGTRLAPRLVSTTAALGLPPDWVEAAAFAWLARQAWTGQPGNLPSVTGAAGPRILGCIYPA